jgi:hypothetical protein
VFHDLVGQLLRECYGIGALKLTLTEQLQDVERLLSLELHEEEQAVRARELAWRVQRESLRLNRQSVKESSKVITREILFVAPFFLNRFGLTSCSLHCLQLCFLSS